jgi:hypothetical protein
VGDKPGHDFFRLLAQKLEEYQVPMPTVQIEYKNLTVKTQAMVGSAGIPTAGNFGPQLLKVNIRWTGAVVPDTAAASSADGSVQRSCPLQESVCTGHSLLPAGLP